jgi:hypothetical protein
MKNITLAVSDKTYTAARVWAATNQTSVSGIVQIFLDSLPAMKPLPDIGARIARVRRLALANDKFAAESAKNPITKTDPSRAAELGSIFLEKLTETAKQ